MYEEIREKINELIETRNHYFVYSWKRENIYRGITIEKREDGTISKWLKVIIEGEEFVLSKRNRNRKINTPEYETIFVTKDIEELMVEITNIIIMNSMMGEG